MLELNQIENKMPLILIADENNEMLQYISSLLNSYEILTAQDGKTALNLVYERHPQVILANMQLPLLSSFELIKALKADLHYEHIPIIIFNNKNENKDIERCIQTGADDYLSFPFMNEELEARISASLRHYHAYRKLLVINAELLNTIQNFLNASEEIQNNRAGLELIFSLAKLPRGDYTMAHALEVFVEGISKLQGWSIGHIYMVERERESDSVVLYPSNIWYLSDPQKYKSFKDATNNTIIQNEMGLPGRVYAKKQVCWIENIKNEENFLRAEFVQNLELYSAVGLPIICHGKVIAVAEFFSHQKLLKNKNVLDIITTAASQLELMLEQRCNEEKLKIKEKELDQVNQQLNALQNKIPPVK